ncbi:hypothetical protein [Corallococcus macrosporus]|uniref:Beta-ketoacyl synthase N-terminal domain-containing protein n=1 Tax=Corallococcus macrosporus DSM 14697 TaxID=1189310 RepID=A0A250JPA9_9BACT|nr:hypothetical protein [Corallococcus macrosporus]ATB45714.1 hypothetical protein MYMAC_001299 [Corallococcus macrosporus DSM 14697]
MKVFVEALGMASCLGPAIPACAAFRANLLRPSPSPDVDVAEPGEEVPRPVTVCALPAATFGFSGVGRLVALACEVLKDVGTRVDLRALGPETGVCLALPDPWERGLDLGEPDASVALRVEALGRRVLDTSLRNLGLEWSGPRRFFGGGHVAFARALHAAEAALRSGGLRSCVVMGVDCLVEAPTLHALADERRLKTPEQPVGLTPGEAGAALFLTTEALVEPSRGEAQVVLHAVRLGDEPHPRGADRPSDGRALAACAEAVLAAAGVLRARPLLVSDHNGEEGRAREWGMVLLHLRAMDASLEELQAWYPAIGFGDVGAAMGAVNACVAVRGLQRGYAPSSVSLVFASADDSGRAAILAGTTPEHPSGGAPP